MTPVEYFQAIKYRVVIPKELRETMGLPTNTPMEIFVDRNDIVLCKYEPGCTFCGELEELKDVRGKYVCQHCLKELTQV